MVHAHEVLHLFVLFHFVSPSCGRFQHVSPSIRLSVRPSIRLSVCLTEQTHAEGQKKDGSTRIVAYCSCYTPFRFVCCALRVRSFGMVGFALCASLPIILVDEGKITKVLPLNAILHPFRKPKVK